MSDEKKVLAPVEQKQVEFYGDTITAVRLEDGRVYVPIRPICVLIGVDWEGQRQRIKRDIVLSEVVMSAFITQADIDPQSKRPRTSQMLCFPIDYLNGWLFGINANRVKAQIRDSLLRYQRECYKVLADAFGRNQITVAPSTEIDDLLNSDLPEAQAYKMAMAIASIARQQLLMRSEISENTTQIAAHETRLTTIEAQLGNPKRFVTKDQASQISQSVKSIALELGKVSGRNEFGGVYGELYRRFGITSYKEMPATKFDQAMNFLRQWYQKLTDITAPF